jgi:putative transposase
MAYIWRKLDEEKRKELLAWRMARRHPWHSPPHRANFGQFNYHVSAYHVSAACFRHDAFIGYSRERMESFSGELLETLQKSGAVVQAWCVLPNHYHLLIRCEDLKLFDDLGKFHGRTSFTWNAEDRARGRQIFCRASDRWIRSERHFWATMNYVQNNPVHHGYVKLWTEWPWSSAAAYLESVGREEAERVWRSYPVKDYGAKWDAARI